MVNNEGARGMMGRRKERRHVIIMGNVTLSFGCYMVCCYNYFISGSLYIFELFSFILGSFRNDDDDDYEDFI